MRKMILTCLFLISSSAFAGGIHCRQCPSESPNCIPKKNCHEYLDRVADLSNGICPTNSVLACKGNNVGASCSTEEFEGVCEIAPVANGSFCSCEG